MEIKNYIYVDEWEISFMQDDGPMTVCVIRHLKKLDQRFIGLAICNPKDIWDDAIGRHKALKDALTNAPSDNVWTDDPDDINGFSLTIKNETTRDIRIFNLPGLYHRELPVKAIQRAYWEHYKEEEKENYE